MAVEDEIGRLLARDDVEYIHVRDSSAGCYDFRVERASTPGGDPRTGRTGATVRPLGRSTPSDFSGASVRSPRLASSRTAPRNRLLP
jgi:hypothetical protein